jgi:hypothetical protein
LEELEALAPETGEEAALAERRQFLMRAEKIAADLYEAQETVGGNASPVPDLVGLVRRLDRKTGELPDMLSGTIEALNAGYRQPGRKPAVAWGGDPRLRVRAARTGKNGGAALCTAGGGAQTPGRGR